MYGVKSAAAVVCILLFHVGWLAQQGAAAGVADARVQVEGQLPDVRYRITCRADDAAPHWLIEVNATGLDRAARDVEMRLSQWGDWTMLDAYYFIITESQPAAVREWSDPGLVRFDYPDHWDGTINLTYRLNLLDLGSNAQRSFGRLLPIRAEHYSAGFVHNTLIGVQCAGGMLAAHRTIELVAPPDWSVVTGWAGISEHHQATVLERDDQNGIIAFGVPTHIRQMVADDGTPLEVVQFSDGPDAATATMDIARTVLPLYSRHLDRPAGRPVRVILVNGHGGGTHTDYGLLVDPPRHPEGIASPQYAQLVAHELFHIWLGGFIEPGSEPMEWFYEGFTDYLAAWHLASAGLASAQWFIDRIIEWEFHAEASGVREEAVFADRDVHWRGEGFEQYAYNGGAVLAFMLDHELRSAGKPGLPMLMKHVLHDGDAVRTPSGNVELRMAPIRTWLKQQGLGDFVRRHIDAAERLDVAAALAALGCIVEDTDVPLTYLGISADRNNLPATVVIVEQDSPADRAGVRVGDYVVGYAPTRDKTPRIGPDITTTHRFGLTLFEPHYPGAFIDVVRDRTEVRIALEPEIISGGVIERTRADAERLASFLQYDQR